MASITEVAKRAGVSVATASRVVSEADYPVSAAARERVLRAAHELDYVPNALARGLLKHRVPVVGVIVHDITDPYFAEVVRGVEDAATARGFLVITCSSERDADRERSYLKLLRSIRAAAVVFAGSGRDDPALASDLGRHVAGMREVGAAVVHLSPSLDGPPEVGVDNAAGVAALVRALADLGHRRIALLAGPTGLLVARDRLAGYRQGLADAGLDTDDSLIVHTSFDRDGGALGVDALLDRGSSFTALCCANDLLALGALARLGERGVVVPDDVSVAGFDDIAVAELTSPPLSSVRVPLRELGRRGFAAVERILAGSEPGNELLPTEVVLRASTAPPASTISRGAAAAGAPVTGSTALSTDVLPAPVGAMAPGGPR